MTNKIDKFHMHEFIDRVHCVRLMVDNMLFQHLVGDTQFKEELEEIDRKLGNLYQKAGNYDNKETLISKICGLYTQISQNSVQDVYEKMMELDVDVKKSTVNATLNNMAKNGILKRVGHGLYEKNT